MRRSALFASIGALSTAAIWGFAFVVVKDSLSSIGPLWMMTMRFSIAAAAMALLFVRLLPSIKRTHLLHGAVLGVLLFGAYVFQTVGCVYTTAGKNAFLTAAYVVLVPLLGWAFGGKRPRWAVFAAALIALLGIALLSLGASDGGQAAGGQTEGTPAELSLSVCRVNLGDVLTMVCAVFFAVHIIYMARSSMAGGMNDVMINSVLQFAVAALLSALAAVFFDGQAGGIIHPPPASGFSLSVLHSKRVIMSMLYLGVFSTMAGFVLQNIALKYLRPAIATILLSFESAFAALFSALCLGERLTGRMAFGCALIFTAVILAQLKGES